jgi:hypothetical protein
LCLDVLVPHPLTIELLQVWDSSLDIGGAGAQFAKQILQEMEESELKPLSLSASGRPAFFDIDPYGPTETDRDSDREREGGGRMSLGMSRVSYSENNLRSRFSVEGSIQGGGSTLNRSDTSRCESSEHSNDGNFTHSHLPDAAQATFVVSALQNEMRKGRDPDTIDGYLYRTQHIAAHSDTSAQRLITAGIIPSLVSILRYRFNDSDRLGIILVTWGLLAYAAS